VTVKELINKLSELDSELEVIHFSEYDELVLDINEINYIEAEKIRSNDGKPLLKFGKSDVSKKYVGIELTSDF